MRKWWLENLATDFFFCRCPTPPPSTPTPVLLFTLLGFFFDSFSFHFPVQSDQLQAFNHVQREGGCIDCEVCVMLPLSLVCQVQHQWHGNSTWWAVWHWQRNHSWPWQRRNFTDNHCAWSCQEYNYLWVQGDPPFVPSCFTVGSVCVCVCVCFPWSSFSSFPFVCIESPAFLFILPFSVH